MITKAFLNRHLAHIRRTMARSTAVARAAVRVRDQCQGIIIEHLGHDIDMESNGELWILRQLAPGSRTFVDIGANVGDWTASFLQLEAKARGWLVEPSETAATRLEARFQGDPRVQICRTAASDRSGNVTFFEEPNAGQTSSLTPGFSRGDAAQRVVPAVTIDALITAQGLGTVDYLKIDAEGHDLHVLRGATETLRAGRIRAVQFEYNRPWQQAGSTLADAFSLLEGVGYEPFLLKGSRLHRLPYGTYGEFFHYSNFVAFPRDRISDIQHLVGGAI